MTNAVAIAQSGSNNVSFRNRIINGAMTIDQRNAGAAVSNANGYTLDRWYLLRGASSSSPVFNVQQSTTAPSNYVNSLSITVGTSGAPGSGNFSTLYQIIEGFNTADFGWGTASAQPVTLSFWIRSSVTGTFGISFQNSALNRSYIATYTIAAANTWEYKTVTIAGDTSGTWLTNNGAGVAVHWDLGVGTGQSTTAGTWQAGNFLGLTGGTKLSNTGSATFLITGVQLEEGTAASPFENRLYGTELALCQRYYWKISEASILAGVGSGYVVSATAAAVVIPMNVNMRVSPTIAYGGTVYVQDGAGSAVTSILNNYGGRQSCFVQFAASGLTAGRGLACFTNSTSSDFVSGSAEL